MEERYEDIFFLREQVQAGSQDLQEEEDWIDHRVEKVLMMKEK